MIPVVKCPPGCRVRVRTGTEEKEDAEVEEEFMAATAGYRTWMGLGLWVGIFARTVLVGAGF